MLKSLQNSSKVTSLFKALTSFQRISKFLLLVIIDDYKIAKSFFPQDSPITETSTKKEIAYQLIDCYEKEASKFYTNAHASFMSLDIPGDGETFYIHSITKYIPVIMRRTYDQHKLGVGIFTMEGFEYKNIQASTPFVSIQIEKVMYVRRVLNT